LYLLYNNIISLKQEHFIELVDYITVMPPDEEDALRAFRYPFYACELLCCDNSTVVDAFFPGEESVDEDAEVVLERQEK
jgi:serine/threonine-protein phosphatase 6 regulatory subunit 3